MSAGRRVAKIAEAIREVVSTAILTELRDPRIGHVTILGVDVPPDLRTANVRFSVLGEEKDEHLTLQGLRSARGFLQAKIADRIELRHTPILSFEIDHGVKQSIAASQILKQLREREWDTAEGDAAEGDAAEGDAAEGHTTERHTTEGHTTEGNTDEGDSEVNPEEEVSSIDEQSQRDSAN